MYNLTYTIVVPPYPREQLEFTLSVDMSTLWGFLGLKVFKKKIFIDYLYEFLC